MKNEDFLKTVQAAYINDPFGLSGIAFWKVEEQIMKADTFQVDTPQAGVCLYAVVKQKLVFYWSEKDEPIVIPHQELKGFRLLSLHSRFEKAVENLQKTHQINAYAPLNYERDSPLNDKTNENFRTGPIDRGKKDVFSDLASIINENTEGNLTSKEIEAWTEIGPYAPGLWIGASDKKNNELVGVGISTYNPAVMETDLDWFYIRKEYQGRGIGRMLVRETISRCRKKSRIIRVTGLADGFYKKCGFVQKDKWYFLTKKFTQAAWWD